jgi:hypothetical protein
MRPNSEEAAKILNEVADVSKHVHHRASFGIVGPILIIWGTIWIVCFNITHFKPGISAWSWLIGNMIGITGSLYFGRMHPRATAIQSDTAKQTSRRLFWFWLLLFVYADIWLAILWPWGTEQLGTFIVTLIMFAYVVLGIWLGLHFLLWLGLGVTGVAVAGYFMSSMIPGYQNLLLGLLGGSALLVSGLYLMRYNRVTNF